MDQNQANLSGILTILLVGWDGDSPAYRGSILKTMDFWLEAYFDLG